MDKKDIYEHLANIYLDASTKKKKKAKESRRFKYLFYTALSALFLLSFALSAYISKTKRIADARFALVLQSEAAKINYNFDPANKEIYSINMKSLDLNKYKALGFAVKKANYRDRIALMIEFINARQEKGEVYVKFLQHKWQDYQLPLAGFKGIGDWSNMHKLNFVVEEWNSSEKKGIVYLDNIRLLR